MDDGATLDLLALMIIWCDESFETQRSYETMQNEFNETATGTIRRPPDPFNPAILAEGQAALRLNHIPLIVVRTADDTERELVEHQNKKIFVICSGTMGRHLVPTIAKKYPLVHNIYLYAFRLDFYIELVATYDKLVKIFDFHTDLLVRLTRDIAKHFIQRGQMYLATHVPKAALTVFRHAEQLEHAANQRAKIPVDPNDQSTYGVEPDFRAHLDLLQGDEGLIAKAEQALRDQGQPVEAM